MEGERVASPRAGGLQEITVSAEGCLTSKLEREEVVTAG